MASREYSAAYRAFVRLVRANAAGLSVRKWVTWDGSIVADDEPTAATCPWVRFTPGTMRGSRLSPQGGAAELIATYQWTIGIETAVKAAKVDDALDFAAGLVEAMIPTDSTTRETMDAALIQVGIVDVIVEAPPVPQGIDDYGEEVFTGAGSVTLVMHLEA